MIIKPLYKIGLTLLLIGLAIKITALIINDDSMFSGGLTFSLVGIGLVGFDILFRVRTFAKAK